MNGKMDFHEMGLPSQITAQRIEPPVSSARGLRDLEYQKGMNSLGADILSAILLAKKGWPVPIAS